MIEIIDGVWPPQPGKIRLTEAAIPRGGVSNAGVGRLFGDFLRANVDSEYTRAAIIHTLVESPDSNFPTDTEVRAQFVTSAIHAAQVNQAIAGEMR